MESNSGLFIRTKPQQRACQKLAIFMCVQFLISSVTLFVYIEGDTTIGHHHQCCPASMCLHWHSCSNCLSSLKPLYFYVLFVNIPTSLKKKAALWRVIQYVFLMYKFLYCQNVWLGSTDDTYIGFFLPLYEAIHLFSQQREVPSHNISRSRHC